LQFFVFLELSLVPVYFLIGIWGGPRKEHAAIKFFLFNMTGSMAILAAIVGIVYHTRGTSAAGGGGLDMIGLAMDPAIKAVFGRGGEAFGFGTIAFWLLFAGFAVKIPLVPLHTWLADALAEAPTPVSMLVAAVVLKIGAYGLLRVAYPIFPQQAADGWFYAALIGVVTIVHGGLVALAQKDFKRLVACSTVSQMGYIVLGIAVMTPMAAAGALFAMLAQGISAAMMFFIVGVIFDRAHHREIPRLGGLWAQMPIYTGWAAIGFFAWMGLPGLCGFVGQLLVLLGTFAGAHQDAILMQHTLGGALKPLIWLGSIAAAAVILTTGYLLWTLQRVYMGAPKPEYHNFPGLTSSEKWILGTLGVAAILLGVMPQLILDPIRPAIEGVMKLMAN
jgi:NADH-quinone oxidoreductase subunit M